MYCYGKVDEANSAIGMALSFLPAASHEIATGNVGFADVLRMGERVQRDLFDVGRDLATPEDKQGGFHVSQEDVDLLEHMIDVLDVENPPLQRFVLPGGHPAAAAFHVARTVVREAERDVLALQKKEPVQPFLRKYLNRLSDLLFVMARLVNTRTGTAEPGVDFTAEKPDPFRKNE